MNLTCLLLSPIAAIARRIPSSRRLKPWLVSRSRTIKISKHFTFTTRYSDIRWSTEALPDLLTRHLLFEGTYQEDVIQIILHVCNPGEVVFDVGGHHGYMSLVAISAVGSIGRVITFEPNPYARRWIKHNIELNNKTNISVMPVAIGASKGSARLHIQKGTCTWNTSLFKNAFSDGYETEEITVDITTIDDYVRESGIIPKLIKIDIEGSEFLALQGAFSTIATHRPALILEFNPVSAKAANVVIKDIVARLHDYGYDLTVLRKNRWGRYAFGNVEAFSENKHCHDDLCNVLCLPTGSEQLVAPLRHTRCAEGDP